MLPLRLYRVLAIAWRDLRQEFRGRRGVVLPLVSALLLVPLAAMPTFGPKPTGQQVLRVSGQVPAQVAALPQVQVVTNNPDTQFALEGDQLARRPHQSLYCDRQPSTSNTRSHSPTSTYFQYDFARLACEQTPDKADLSVSSRGLGEVSGQLTLRGAPPPPAVRQALDELGPSPVVVALTTPVTLPRRSLFFGLLAASVLMGALAESIPGERSRATLQTLLTASVGRGEIVVGKWLAWAGYGVCAAMGAGVVTSLMGRLPAGAWLIPLPTVPMATVALGLYMVRRARDVVGGATITLRVLPAVVSIAGVMAWVIGQQHPYGAALVPLGGALVASGSPEWGLGPTVLATVVGLATTVLLLWRTAAELEGDEGLAPAPGLHKAFGLATLAAGFAWGLPVVFPLLWAPAGNPNLTASLPIAPTLVTGALGLVLVASVQAAQGFAPVRALGMTLPRSRALAWALPVGGLLAMLALFVNVKPYFSTDWIAAIQHRMALGIEPLAVGILPGLLVIAAQELLFRGVLLQMVGPVVAVVAWVLVCGPLDPLVPLLLGGLLVGLTRLGGGSVVPAIVARVVFGAVVAGFAG